jgi:hypothetical protein
MQRLAQQRGCAIVMGMLVALGSARGWAAVEPPIEPPIAAPDPTTPESTAVAEPSKPAPEPSAPALDDRSAAPVVQLGAAGLAMPPAVVPSGPLVWIESDSTGVTLSRYDGGGRSGVLCRDACGVSVDDRGRPVQLEGDRLPPSARFELPRGHRELSLHVRGNLGMWITGLSLTGLSGIALGFGGWFTAWGRIDGDPWERNLGVALVGTGAAMLATGLVLVLLGRTRVKIVPRGGSRQLRTR